MIETLGIILGYRCNFKCEHCITGDKSGQGLTGGEKSLIAEAAKKYGIRHVLFIGGEPTLYIEDMNDIVGRFGEPAPRIRMTTNGHFARNRAEAVRTLSSISKLSGINLSYDSLHAKFLPEANIEILYSACKELGMDFDVLMSLRSPMDLVLLNKLRKAGRFPVLLQKMLPVGAAKTNDLGFKYPSFDEGVLSAFCPNRKKIVYFCGQGFSACCGALSFESASSRFVSPTVQEHRAGEFYKLIAANNFSEIIKKLGLTGLKMLPEHSTPCVLCEYIFRSKYGAEF